MFSMKRHNSTVCSTSDPVGQELWDTLIFLFFHLEKIRKAGKIWTKQVSRLIYLSIYLLINNISLFIYIYLSTYPSVHLSIYLFIYLSNFLKNYHLSLSPYIYQLYIYLSIYLSKYLSIYIFISPSHILPQPLCFNYIHIFCLARRRAVWRGLWERRKGEDGKEERERGKIRRGEGGGG